jgi:hypothetical protein
MLLRSVVHWINENINHFAVPFGILLGLMSAFIGFTVQKKRKAGLPPPYLPEGFRIAALLFILVACIFFGITLAHNFG